MSPHARARGSAKGAARTGRVREKPGLKLGRSQKQEKAERGVFQAPNLGAAQSERCSPLILGLLGRKPRGRKCGPSPPSPLPQSEGGASSTHVSGKERKCQIAPHPLVSDGQPKTVALKLELNLLPSSPPNPPAVFVFKKEG
ncbi:unnamed protein product [Rangifer tarandus platyrhynchus]|uniref:Uncharacterized protein n=1 Tax=Rangifer tarandus platyrhynchus TaxID=3082113 RepID=A0ABN9A5B0_RANTA|nr:unnamed protein product [Rangifer tarandus platyrhynchus]